jgi:hypothetical protein
MGRWSVLVLCSAMACGPEVRDQANVEVAELPMACGGPLLRTSAGTWACPLSSSRVGVTRGAEVQELPGDGVAVSGAAVWTWKEVLRRYEDSGDGGLLQFPDAG